VHLDWLALAVTTGFSMTAAAAAAMIYSIVGSRTGAVRRLQRRLAPSPDLPDLVESKGKVAHVVARGLKPLAKLASPIREDELSAIRTKLNHAGFRSSAAVQIFLAVKVILALGFVVVLLWFNAARLNPISMLPAWGIGVASFGFFLPNAWLAARARERQRLIDEGLPDVLDLMVTCVEAGLGLDAAVQRVAAEMTLARPILAEELTLTFLEVKAGARRAEAFRRLADRTGVQDLKTLAATLNQTDMFGTSVGQALRVQSEGMRVHRMQRAEERAGVLSVKMTVPLVVCFLPSLMAVILGPAWVNIVETLHHR
jgi:tight adherence protein C